MSQSASPSASPLALHRRVQVLEERADESEATMEHLGATVNDVRIGNAKILKNLGVLMQAQGVEMVELNEDEVDEIFD